MKFILNDLPYSFDALEPYIDSKTVEIHFTKHHKTYTDNLNNLITGTQYENMDISNILIKSFNSDISIRNNAGGYYNHNMFWEILKPSPYNKVQGKILDLLVDRYGSYEDFKDIFKQKSLGHFGSGWTWLIINNSLDIVTTKNQDNPIMPLDYTNTGKPILCLDLWEHSYYLKYQNKRADYIDAFFNIINWDVVNSYI